MTRWGTEADEVGSKAQAELTNKSKNKARRGLNRISMDLQCTIRTMSIQSQPETKTCGRCGQKFPCHAKIGGCWCEKLPILPKAIPDCDCLCPACLEKELKAQGAGKP